MIAPPTSSAGATAAATVKAILTMPGTARQALHPPAVTLAAFWTTLASFILAVAPELPILHDYLVTLLGAVLATKVIAGVTIAAAVIGGRSAHIAATGRSIVPWVDSGAPPPPNSAT